MEPIFETVSPKWLVGMCMEMSTAQNRTAELWQKFMLRRREIKQPYNTGFISMQVYDPEKGSSLALGTVFTKWAVVEVENEASIPDAMEIYRFQGGKYAVFDFQGPARDAPKIFGYIFGEWLPNSNYQLDTREHFEVLGENYRPDDPQAKEKIYIPVRQERMEKKEIRFTVPG